MYFLSESLFLGVAAEPEHSRKIATSAEIDVAIGSILGQPGRISIAARFRAKYPEKYQGDLAQGQSRDPERALAQAVLQPANCPAPDEQQHVRQQSHDARRVIRLHKSRERPEYLALLRTIHL